MANGKRTNRHQRDFLRRLRLHPAGLPVTDWPSPAALRRWMRHEGFVRSMTSIRETMQVQTDLQLMSAGALASGGLSAMLATAQPVQAGGPEATDSRLRALVHILRMVQFRKNELQEMERERKEIEATEDPPYKPHSLHRSHWGNPEKLAQYWQMTAELLKQEREKKLAAVERTRSAIGSGVSME